MGFNLPNGTDLSAEQLDTINRPPTKDREPGPFSIPRKTPVIMRCISGNFDYRKKIS